MILVLKILVILENLIILKIVILESLVFIGVLMVKIIMTAQTFISPATLHPFFLQLSKISFTHPQRFHFHPPSIHL